MAASFDLTGKVAIVTGGNGGIGYGMARGLAQAGASIVIAARRAEKNAQAVAALHEMGAKALSVVTDVQDEASVQAMVQATVAAFGSIDILVNNAGINIRKAPQDYTLMEWQAVLNTNLTGVFLCSRSVYPYHGQGRRRQDHQYRFHDVHFRQQRLSSLWGDQGRGGAVH